MASMVMSVHGSAGALTSLHSWVAALSTWSKGRYLSPWDSPPASPTIWQQGRRLLVMQRAGRMGAPPCTQHHPSPTCPTLCALHPSTRTCPGLCLGLMPFPILRLGAVYAANASWEASEIRMGPLVGTEQRPVHPGQLGLDRWSLSFMKSAEKVSSLQKPWKRKGLNVALGEACCGRRPDTLAGDTAVLRCQAGAEAGRRAGPW